MECAGNKTEANTIKGPKFHIVHIYIYIYIYIYNVCVIIKKLEKKKEEITKRKLNRYKGSYG